MAAAGSALAVMSFTGHKEASRIEDTPALTVRAEIDGLLSRPQEHFGVSPG